MLWVQILPQPCISCVDSGKSAYLSLAYKVENMPPHSQSVCKWALVKAPIWHPGHWPALNGSNYYYNYFHFQAWISGSPKMPKDQLQVIRLHVADIWAQRSEWWGCVSVTKTCGTWLMRAQATGWPRKHQHGGGRAGVCPACCEVTCLVKAWEHCQVSAKCTLKEAQSLGDQGRGRARKPRKFSG